MTPRGSAAAHQDSFVAVAIPMPAGTVVGDLFVLAATYGGAPPSDPRLIPLSANGWYGFATTLDDIGGMTSGAGSSYAIASFAPVEILDTASVSGIGNGYSLPSVAAPAVIHAGVSSSPGIGVPSVPEGFTAIIDSPTASTRSRIDVWTGTAPSPTAFVETTSLNQGYASGLVGVPFGGVYLDTVRKYPLDVRGYPPTRAPRGGRYVGGYH